MKRNRITGIGERVYPSPTASPRGEQLGVTPFRRCQNCGLPNDTRSTAWSDEVEDGLSDAFNVSVAAVTGQTQHDTKDRNVQSGCRFCGSLNWLSSKPEALPDDRNKPSDEWRIRRRRRV